MKTASAFPVRIGLLVATDQKNGYFHATASPVTIGPTAWEQRWRHEHPNEDRPAYADITPTTIRNAGDDLHNGLRLDSLHVTSQGNHEDDPRHLYAWEVRYRDLYAVTLRDATAMYKTLAAIDRRMERLDGRYGRPATFGAYVARVADAIGADAIVTVDGRSSGWHHQDAHRIETIGAGVLRFDHEIRRWMDGRMPQPAGHREETATA